MKIWSTLLEHEKEADYFKEVMQFVDDKRQSGTVVYPDRDDVFKTFELTKFAEIRVVILGQDPYHGANQAHGLCFSVKKGVPIPPSLKNIYKELASDLGIKAAEHGDLASWAKQGVFLLNSVLTVEASKANSHRNKGWETFTDQVIKIISEHSEHVVFLLWGNPAHKKIPLIDAEKHSILTTVHPSPLSAYRGFLGCRHFSKANQALLEHGQNVINWTIEN
ncbi:MAG: uracil-DNA glycosylase [Enterobacterales bacterium]|jgi:uracil-DNA glycosylase